MKRASHDGDEMDAFSPWHHYLSSWQRAGKRKAVKRRANRRERREVKRKIERNADDL